MKKLRWRVRRMAVKQTQMKVFALTFLLSLWAYAPAFATDHEPVNLVEKKLLKTDAKYAWHEIRLRSKLTGEFKIWHRGPRESQQPLPVIFLLAGVQSNRQSLDLLGDANAHVFTLDYAIGFGGKPEEVFAAVGRRFLQIQAEYLCALFWIMQNSDQYDFSRFSSINVSFGSFIAPMALRVAEQFHVLPKATVFAFGGADVKEFVLPLLVQIDDDELRGKADKFLSEVFDEIDPARHLRHLQGPFLVIRGAKDQVIPATSADALQNALPEKDKTVVILPTGHIDVDQPEIISATRAATMDFLIKKGAL